MELTIRKDINPNDLKLVALGIGDIYNVMLGSEYLFCVHAGQKETAESIFSMARAYYNFAEHKHNFPKTENVDDLKDVLNPGGYDPEPGDYYPANHVDPNYDL